MEEIENLGRRLQDPVFLAGPHLSSSNSSKSIVFPAIASAASTACGEDRDRDTETVYQRVNRPDTTDGALVNNRLLNRDRRRERSVTSPDTR